MNDAILAAITTRLDEAGIEYRQLHHEPTRTSEDSARARGESLASGGKALLLKTGDDFRLFVFSAARKLDSAAVKKRFDLRKLRFATPEELAQQTGLVPGAVPPFGEPILPYPLFVDTSITENERIAFNAGSLTDSIIMSVEDYVRFAEPEVFSFSKGQDPVA
jgi:prolyl-tRNA editing enzyme YbaK/EbsC (Cys-tRNA(Pro) deacylase)